jgi:sugar O-acyltransferase (sialic acid O-acetyltransferase NeuD family)
MRDLLLVGASGLAREVAAGLGGARQILGYLDEDPGRYGRRLGGLPVLGGLELARDLDADLLVCVGSGRARRGIVDRLAGLGIGADRFGRFVSPGAHLPMGTPIGPGSILLAGVVVTTDVTVGAHVVVMPNATLTHDNVLHDYVTIAAGAALGGYVVIGPEGYLGMNASVHPRMRIGTGAVVGMGAVVLTDVPPNETWAGVPARRIRVDGAEPLLTAGARR